MPCVMVSSTMGPPTHTQKQMQNKCIYDLCAPRGILRVFIFTQTAVDAGDIRT